MKLPRLSIARLMGLIVLIAVGLASLAHPSRLSAMGLTAGFLTALTLALIGVVNARGVQRAFWSGFLIAGWSYMLLDYRADLIEALGRWELVDALVNGLEEVLNPSPAPPLPTVILDTNLPIDPSAPAVPPPPVDPGFTGRNQTAFQRIGHMELAWLAAIAGGFAARWMARSSRPDPP